MFSTFGGAKLSWLCIGTFVVAGQFEGTIGLVSANQDGVIAAAEISCATEDTAMLQLLRPPSRRATQTVSPPKLARRQQEKRRVPRNRARRQVSATLFETCAPLPFRGALKNASVGPRPGRQVGAPTFECVHDTRRSSPGKCACSADEFVLESSLALDRTVQQSCCPRGNVQCAGCALYRAGRCEECRGGFSKFVSFGGALDVCVACSSTSWADSEGHACEDYLRNEWCFEGSVTESGAVRASMKHQGLSAAEACCVCGGGQKSATPFDFHVEPAVPGGPVIGFPVPRTAVKYGVNSECALGDHGLTVNGSTGELVLAESSSEGLIPLETQPFSTSCLVTAFQADGIQANATIFVEVNLFGVPSVIFLPSSGGSYPVVRSWKTLDALFSMICNPILPWLELSSGVLIDNSQEPGPSTVVGEVWAGQPAGVCSISAHDDEATESTTATSRILVVKIAQWASFKYPIDGIVRLTVGQTLPPIKPSIDDDIPDESKTPLAPSRFSIACDVGEGFNFEYDELSGAAFVNGHEVFALVPTDGALGGTPANAAASLLDGHISSTPRSNKVIECTVFGHYLTETPLPAAVSQTTVTTTNPLVSLHALGTSATVARAVVIEILDDTCWVRVDGSDFSVRDTVLGANSENACRAECRAMPACTHYTFEFQACNIMRRTPMQPGNFRTVTARIPECREALTCIEVRVDGQAYLGGNYCPVGIDGEESHVYQKIGPTVEDSFYLVKFIAARDASVGGVQCRDNSYAIRQGRPGEDFLDPDGEYVELRGAVFACSDLDDLAYIFDNDQKDVQFEVANESFTTAGVAQLAARSCVAPNFTAVAQGEDEKESDEEGDDGDEGVAVLVFDDPGTPTPMDHWMHPCDCFPEAWGPNPPVSPDSFEATPQGSNNKYIPSTFLIVEGEFVCDAIYFLDVRIESDTAEMADADCEMWCIERGDCNFYFTGQQHELSVCRMYSDCKTLVREHAMQGRLKALTKTPLCHIANPDLCWATTKRRSFLTGLVPETVGACAYESLLQQCDHKLLLGGLGVVTCSRCTYMHVPLHDDVPAWQLKRTLPEAFMHGDVLQASCWSERYSGSPATRDIQCSDGTWFGFDGKPEAGDFVCVADIQIVEPGYAEYDIRRRQEIYFANRLQAQIVVDLYSGRECFSSDSGGSIGDCEEQSALFLVEALPAASPEDRRYRIGNDCLRILEGPRLSSTRCDVTDRRQFFPPRALPEVLWTMKSGGSAKYSDWSVPPKSEPSVLAGETWADCVDDSNTALSTLGFILENQSSVRSTWKCGFAPRLGLQEVKCCGLPCIDLISQAPCPTDGNGDNLPEFPWQNEDSQDVRWLAAGGVCRLNGVIRLNRPPEASGLLARLPSKCRPRTPGRDPDQPLTMQVFEDTPAYRGSRLVHVYEDGKVIGAFGSGTKVSLSGMIFHTVTEGQTRLSVSDQWASPYGGVHTKAVNGICTFAGELDSAEGRWRGSRGVGRIGGPCLPQTPAFAFPGYPEPYAFFIAMSSSSRGGTQEGPVLVVLQKIGFFEAQISVWTQGDNESPGGRVSCSGLSYNTEIGQYLTSTTPWANDVGLMYRITEREDSERICTVEGRVRSLDSWNWGPGDDIITTLPPGCRPAQRMEFPAVVIPEGRYFREWCELRVEASPSGSLKVVGRQDCIPDDPSRQNYVLDIGSVQLVSALASCSDITEAPDGREICIMSPSDMDLCGLAKGDTCKGGAAYFASQGAFYAENTESKLLATHELQCAPGMVLTEVVGEKHPTENALAKFQYRCVGVSGLGACTPGWTSQYATGGDAGLWVEILTNLQVTCADNGLLSGFHPEFSDGGRWVRFKYVCCSAGGVPMSIEPAALSLADQNIVSGIYAAASRDSSGRMVFKAKQLFHDDISLPVLSYERKTATWCLQDNLGCLRDDSAHPLSITPQADDPFEVAKISDFDGQFDGLGTPKSAAYRPRRSFPPLVTFKGTDPEYAAECQDDTINDPARMARVFEEADPIDRNVNPCAKIAGTGYGLPDPQYELDDALQGFDSFYVQDGRRTRPTTGGSRIGDGRGYAGITYESVWECGQREIDRGLLLGRETYDHQVTDIVLEQVKGPSNSACAAAIPIAAAALGFGPMAFPHKFCEAAVAIGSMVKETVNDAVFADRSLKGVEADHSDCHSLQHGLARLFCDLHCIRDAVKAGDTAILTDIDQAARMTTENMQRLFEYWGGTLDDKLDELLTQRRERSRLSPVAVRSQMTKLFSELRDMAQSSFTAGGATVFRRSLAQYVQDLPKELPANGTEAEALADLLGRVHTLRAHVANSVRHPGQGQRTTEFFQQHVSRMQGVVRANVALLGTWRNTAERSQRRQRRLRALVEHGLDPAVRDGDAELTSLIMKLDTLWWGLRQRFDEYLDAADSEVVAYEGTFKAFEDYMRCQRHFPGLSRQYEQAERAADHAQSKLKDVWREAVPVIGLMSAVVVDGDLFARLLAADADTIEAEAWRQAVVAEPAVKATSGEDAEIDCPFETAAGVAALQKLIQKATDEGFVGAARAQMDIAFRGMAMLQHRASFRGIRLPADSRQTVETALQNVRNASETAVADQATVIAGVSARLMPLVCQKRQKNLGTIDAREISEHAKLVTTPDMMDASDWTSRALQGAPVHADTKSEVEGLKQEIHVMQEEMQTQFKALRALLQNPIVDGDALA